MSETYTYLGGMFSKGGYVPVSETTVKLFDLKKRVIMDEREITMVFCNALKSVLELEAVSEMIEELFSIECQLEQLKENKLFQKFFLMDDFYRNMAPILLRSILENCSKTKLGDGSADSVKEALRVAIEEEIYVLMAEIDEAQTSTFIS